MDAFLRRDYQKKMDRNAFTIRALRDSRLAAHAVAARGAWLFALDGSRLLWSNAAGAAIFGMADPRDGFAPSDEMREQMAQLAARLPLAGTHRLERLHGFGAAFGQRTTCSCARLAFPGATAGILVVEAAASRPLPLTQRLAWLIAATPEPIAVFDAGGKLAAATESAQAAIGSATSLAALGLESACDILDDDGRTEATTERARFALFRIGSGTETATAAFISPFAAQLAGPQAVEPAHSAIDARPALSEALMQATGNVRESVSNDTTSPRDGADRSRLRPLRFVWRTDADGRFTVEDGEFTARMDAPTIAALGRPWRDIAEAYSLDPEGLVASALASRETWNGVRTDWPLDDRRRVNVELSGVAIFGDDRQFAGYRGFGLCRDPDAITQGPEPKAAPLAVPEGGGESETGAEPSRGTTPAASDNIVRFPAPAEPKGELRVPSLSPVENHAFDEIARQLSARLQTPPPAAAEAATPGQDAPVEPPPPVAGGERGESAGERALLDQLPLGILIYRVDQPLYANRAFLDHAGYADLRAFAEVGGLDVLSVASGPAAEGRPDAGASLMLSTPREGQAAVPARLVSTTWEGESATALLVMPRPAPVEAVASADRDHDAARERDDLRAVIETTGDGIAMLDADARILTWNRSAEAIFGIAGGELHGRAFAEFFDAGSRHAVLEALQGAGRVAPAAHQGRDVTIRRRDGEALPLSLSLARLPSGGIFARMVDLSRTKAVEAELATARRRAETAADAKSDAIGRISHDIRTPLAAIIGFADVMIDEQFGPVGNPRYVEYLKDIRASGERVAGLIDDMGNLSRAETGKIDLAFTSVALNAVVEQCAATLQPQANRERIIIRTSLAHGLPPVTADTRTLRQIVLNLIATSIRLSRAGGQVIVSTALTDNGDVALRVRDTGTGLSAQDVSTATEPHRMSATPEQGGTSGAGISLALTRALVEANRARFDVRSAPHAGTLIEVTFAIQRQALAR